MALWVLVAFTDEALGVMGPCFARSGHVVRNKLCWDANNAVGLSKQKKSGWTGKSSFVLDSHALRYLRPSIIVTGS